MRSCNQLARLHFRQHRVNTKQRGFTLMETLVAGFIMFLVLAATVEVYRGGLMSSQKATDTIIEHNSVQTLLPIIQAELQLQHQQDSAYGKTLVGGKPYKWEAQVLANKTRPQMFDADLGQFVTPKGTIKFWQVTLWLGNRNSDRSLSYQELTWSS